jgi:hypothetical protein
VNFFPQRRGVKDQPLPSPTIGNSPNLRKSEAGIRIRSKKPHQPKARSKFFSVTREQPKQKLSTKFNDRSTLFKKGFKLKKPGKLKLKVSTAQVNTTLNFPRINRVLSPAQL